MADFVGILEASFAEKRLVKNGRFCESFPNKFHWKAIGFALIWGKFSKKLDALIAFTQASYRNMKLYFTSKLIEHNKNN